MFKRRNPAILLIPLSLLYGLVICLRNLFFNLKILPSTQFSTPVLSVGNITVGGTGKTPLTEYLIELLRKKYVIAILSRGYKRKTKGFKVADSASTVSEIGDEPKQMQQKYSDIIIAVDSDRKNGIKNLNQYYPQLKAIILDDAYQHRYVKPGLSILLVDYNRPIFSDYLLPYGNLREKSSEIKRAHIIIVTKTPVNTSSSDKYIFIKKLLLQPDQPVFFTSLTYCKILPVFLNANNSIDLESIKKQKANILLVTGIANSTPLFNFLSSYDSNIREIKFSDHHIFTQKNIIKIESVFLKIQNKKKYIITTEKDAIRFKEKEINSSLIKELLYYIPIQVSFSEYEKEKFDNSVIEFVSKYENSD